MHWLRRLLLGLGAAGLMLGPPRPSLPRRADALAARWRSRSRASWSERATPRASPGWRARRVSQHLVRRARPTTPARLTDFTADDGHQLYRSCAFSPTAPASPSSAAATPTSATAALPNAAARRPSRRASRSARSTSRAAGRSARRRRPFADLLAATAAAGLHPRGEIWLWQRGGEARRLARREARSAGCNGRPTGPACSSSSHRGDHSFVALLDPGSAAGIRYLDPGLGFSVEPVFSPDGAPGRLHPPSRAAARRGSRQRALLVASTSPMPPPGPRANCGRRRRAPGGRYAGIPRAEPVLERGQPARCSRGSGRLAARLCARRADSGGDPQGADPRGFRGRDLHARRRRPLAVWRRQCRATSTAATSGAGRSRAERRAGSPAARASKLRRCSAETLWPSIATDVGAPRAYRAGRRGRSRSEPARRRERVRRPASR